MTSLQRELKKGQIIKSYQQKLIANKISFTVLIVILFITASWFFNCNYVTVIFIVQNFDDVIRKLFCRPMNRPDAIPTLVSNVLKIDFSLKILTSKFQLYSQLVSNEELVICGKTEGMLNLVSFFTTIDPFKLFVSQIIYQFAFSFAQMTNKLF